MKNYTVKVFEDGSKVWLLNGERHREDGPAIEFSSGTKAWYLNGEKLTEKEHKRRTTKVTMDDALKAGDAVILREQAERIAELESQRDELLAALEGTAALLEQLGFVSDTSLTVGAARAAIAKAKGE